MPTIPFQTDELAMVAAIHDDPRSDLPRFAYADWLAAHGESDFAEFIRIQCVEPYFTLDKQGIEEATISHDTHRIKFDDPDRAAAAIRLLGRLHPSDRFPDRPFWQEYTRGLPLYALTMYGGTRRYSPEYICGLRDRSPLARYRLSLYTCSLAEWLSEPFLRYVDHLRLYAVDGEHSEGQVPYTADDMRLLAESELLDRLDMLGLSVWMPDEAAAIVNDRISPRVEVQWE